VAEVRRAAARHGITSARMHRSGGDVQRVLLVGDGSFVDEEHDAQGMRFADLLADRITGRTSRGLDLDVLWDLAPVLRAVTSATAAWRLWRYEAVVVLVREPSARERGRRRATRDGRLARKVIPELAEASRVLVVRLRVGEDHPPEPEPEPWDDDRVMSSIGVELGPDGLFQPGPMRADAIADRVATLLRDAGDHALAGGGRTASELRALPEPEAERQLAVDRTVSTLGGVTAHLERVVLMARNTFGVPFAQVNLLDHGRIRTLAFIGAPGEGSEQPICTITVRGSGPTIIADTWEDRRLDGNPHVHGAERPIRFYAAHPIESVDGYRIGTLCVFDLEPHDPTEIDPAVLRDLALLAEAEISTLPD
jgi:hypothetical protein